MSSSQDDHLHSEPAVRDYQDTRSPWQSVIVFSVCIGLIFLYWKLSGGSSDNEIDDHRLIVSQCWDSIERKVPSTNTLQEQKQICERMERGFRQMYGSGA